MRACIILFTVFLVMIPARLFCGIEGEENAEVREVESFIDLDGDGIDDNARDMDDDGIPDAFGTQPLDEADQDLPDLGLLAGEQDSDLNMNAVFKEDMESDSKQSNFISFLLRRCCARDLTQVRGGFDAGTDESDTGGGRPVTCVGGVCF